VNLLRAYRYRLMPTAKQESLFRQYAGASRWVYNQALALNEKRRQVGENRLLYSRLQKELTRWRNDPTTRWLGELPCGYQQNTLRDLDRAYVNLFQDLARPPRFKRKGRVRDAFKTYAPHFKFDGRNRRLRVPGAGWVRFRKDRLPEGAVKNVTISRIGSHWYASILAEMEVAEPVHPSTTDVGVDLGVRKFATLSSGELPFLAPVDRILRLELTIRRAQRKLARKKHSGADGKPSRNWSKQKARIAKLHHCIANVRNDFLHKTTTAISKSHAVVVIEDLQVKSMSRSAKGTVNAPGRNVKAKAGLNRAILRQGWGEFRRQLEYKQRWRGGIVVAVDPKNTSRTCSECGHVSSENRKTQAAFACVACGHQADADVNAARNILAARYAVTACGGLVLSGRPVNQEPPSLGAAQVALPSKTTAHGRGGCR
jgi:putative transposase